MARPKTVLLVGTYGFHRRKSVALFAQVLTERLPAAGWEVRAATLTSPLTGLAQRRHSRSLATLDRLLLVRNRVLLAGLSADLVHFTDTSDAVFLNGWCGSRPTVTCHDLFFLERALADPATSGGQRAWQRAVRRGLDLAAGVAFVSHASAEAYRRVSRRPATGAVERVVWNGPYQVFRRLGTGEAQQRLAARLPAAAGAPYVLNVGSNFERKNRNGVLRAFAAAALPEGTRLVMVGERLKASHRTLATELGIAAAIVEVPEVDTALLEALYNGALALVFPSFEEGFGVPIIEAQQCGCPVVCSDIPVFREIAEGSAAMAPAREAPALGAHLRALLEPARRTALVAAGESNAVRFSMDAMASGYASFFAEVLARRGET